VPSSDTIQPIRFIKSFLAFALTLWAVGALFYDFPWPALRIPLALIYAVVMIGLIVRHSTRYSFISFVIVLAAWLQIEPSNDHPWQPDVAQTAWTTTDGGKITLHNFRNCKYRSEFDYTPRWETRTIDLSKITGIDIAITHWGSEWIAHPILSFQIEGEPPVAISIETRKEIGESYSALAGFYRQYELIYVVGDERDLIGVRTNYRTAEDVYLFRTRTSPARAQAIFVDYLKRLNLLREQPEFYNALTSNCTSNIRLHTRASLTMGKTPAPWDWRLLATGYLAQMLYEHDSLDQSVPFDTLKTQSHINPIARKIGDASDFSFQIREGIRMHPALNMADSPTRP